MTTESSYSTRRFALEDLPAYREIRLEALQLEPGVFGNSYTLESGFTEEQWAARLSDPASACFALYKGDQLIGLTAITTDKEDRMAAYMNQSYIRQPYRGNGLSRLLYEARMNWAREQGITRLVIGHRESNLASKAANQKFGFRYFRRESRLWPDGQKEDMLYYELILES